MTPDSELLCCYARTHSEAAFAELVQRHVNLVYSAAFRQVGGDPHLAKDVAQTVFTDLARKANSLSDREKLTGWLYTSAHFAAAKVVRTENRRRDREQKFMREPTNQSGAGILPVSSETQADWEKIRPALDAAMHELGESDREAILLRYFENRQFAEVGAKLGLNENAARMRVERALEKLRAIFNKRGITTVAALASVISANAVQMAPASLAATLTTASIAAAGTGTFALLKIMTTTKIKLALSALVVSGAATAMVVQHRTQTQLQAANTSLRQRIAQLKTDNENLSNHLASIGDAKSLTDEQLNELLKLRGEVGVFREQTNHLAKDLIGLRDRNRQLQLQIKNMQEQALEKYPELTNVTLFTKHRTEIVNAEKQIGLAMWLFAGDHGGGFPTNLEQLIITNSTNGYLPITDWTNFPGGIGFNDFELLNIGLVHNDALRLNGGPGSVNARYPHLPVLRQRLPLWWDGKWECVYLLDDGAVQVITSDNGDFSAWEKKQLASALSETNQN